MYTRHGYIRLTTYLQQYRLYMTGLSWKLFLYTYCTHLYKICLIAAKPHVVHCLHCNTLRARVWGRVLSSSCNYTMCPSGFVAPGAPDRRRIPRLLSVMVVSPTSTTLTYAAKNREELDENLADCGEAGTNHSNRDLES
jgi:hypothetical protein